MHIPTIVGNYTVLLFYLDSTFHCPCPSNIHYYTFGIPSNAHALRLLLIISSLVYAYLLTPFAHA